MTRLIVCGASVGWSVENTKCPGSPAFSAGSSGSLSRVSPIRITSGGRPRPRRHPPLKERGAVRTRPTPGTPIAKSASLCWANSLTWRGVMICSASDFSSSGLSGDESSGTSSRFTRMVAGRPTLSSRSDSLRWTIWVMAALKLKVACPACGASGMRVHPEEELAELDGLGVLHEHLPYHARDFGLDFIHDLHRFDDADHLARRHPASGLDVRFGTGLRRGIEGPHHG